MDKNKIETIIKKLNLEPLEIEGGYFKRVYESTEMYDNTHNLASAIFYLLTEDTFSHMHKLPTDEMYHFYLGDPVELLELNSDGTGRIRVLGQDIEQDMLVQHTVKANTWQGSKLVKGGTFALLGTTMSPGYANEDYIHGNRKELTEKYRNFKFLIERLTEEEDN